MFECIYLLILVEFSHGIHIMNVKESSREDTDKGNARRRRGGRMRGRKRGRERETKMGVDGSFTRERERERL